MPEMSVVAGNVKLMKKGYLMEIALIGTVGELTFDVCECSGDEENLLITETGLRCCACGTEQPHYN